MLFVCEACGAWCDPLLIEGDERVCRACGARRRFQRLPLFCVTGASGSGKTAVAGRLPDLLPRHVVLEQDVLWRDELADSEEALTAYRRTWLRLGMNIAQSGRPLVLAGTTLPTHYETQPERAFFREIHYVALLCDDDELERRLRERPAWRGFDDERLACMLGFNGWLRHHARQTAPPMSVLDTTDATVLETARAIAAWVEERKRPDPAASYTGP